MKKIVSLCAIVGAFFCFFAFTPIQSSAMTLTYSSFFPSSHIQAQVADAWCKEVTKRTDGRVSVQFFPGQTLTKAAQTYESVTDGICDIGTSALAYTQGRFPVMSAMDLPFGYPSGVAATTVANELYDQMKPKEFSGTKVMYFNAHGPGFIHTRDVPVKTLDNLKGLKIRSTGMSANVVSALGASPVTMAMPDAYQALQKGVVDGSIHPMETDKGWNMGEVVHYCTIAYPAAYTTTFFVVMNKDKWNAIAPKDQKIIEQINDEWAKKQGQAWDSSDKEGKDFFLKQGGKIIQLSDAENAKWTEAISPVFDNYIKELNAKGIDGEKVIKTIRTDLASFK